MTVWCWVLAIPGLAWAAIRLGGVEVGPLVQLLAFTPYAAAWSPLPLAIAAVSRRWWCAGVAAAAAAALVACVLPRWVGSGHHVGDAPVLRVLTVNLLGIGGSAEAVLALVRDRRVDVLAVQELSPEALAALGRSGLAALLPHRSVSPAYAAAGSGVFSRFPLASTGVRTNPSGMRQAYARLLLPGTRPVLVESVHNCSPYTLRQLPCWRADLAAQPPAGRSTGSAGEIRVLAGDFNATLDHAGLRRILGTGYRDAAATVGAGLVGTWGPYDGDPIPPVTIDHVLVDRRVGVRSVSVHGVPGSDHRAVLAELALPASRA